MIQKEKFQAVRIRLDIYRLWRQMCVDQNLIAPPDALVEHSNYGRYHTTAFDNQIVITLTREPLYLKQPRSKYLLYWQLMEIAVQQLNGGKSK